MNEWSVFFEALNVQNNLLIEISAGGFGVIILTWLRCEGILQDDIKIKALRLRCSVLFLLIPMIGFIAVIAIGYLITMKTTGFYFEVMTSSIHDLRTHFLLEYDLYLKISSAIQIFTSGISILFLAFWYAANLFSKVRPKPCPTQSLIC